jgi:hypothetical protein
MSGGPPTAITCAILRNGPTFPSLPQIYTCLNFRAISRQLAPVPFLLLPQCFQNLRRLNSGSRIIQPLQPHDAACAESLMRSLGAVTLTEDLPSAPDLAGSSLSFQQKFSRVNARSASSQGFWAIDYHRLYFKAYCRGTSAAYTGQKRRIRKLQIC